MDKLGIRKLDRASVKPAAATKKWQAATFFAFIFGSVLALCVMLVNSGAKDAPGELPKAAKPLNVEPFLAAPAAPPDPHFTRLLVNAFSSSSALAGRFLRALAEHDQQALKALQLTKPEFCNLVWPELPSSRLPNVTCEWAWEQAELNSLSGFGETLTEHQGRRYELVSMRFADTTSYASFKVHKAPRLVVKDESGRQKELRLFGALLERNGQFKLFSFAID